ncbi:DUF1564 family protein [Leptospira sp. 'Mane']|uniref:DUF1564 family protein n=1 Tax=Leptospira sp. 'Mane' TaxID=3387407 RepID=UPI00398AF331
MDEQIIDYSDFGNWEFIRKRLAVDAPVETNFRLHSGRTSNTCFLIPNDLIDQLRISKGRYFSISGRIRILLEESAYLIYQALILKQRQKLTRTYQVQGLDLKKISCRIADNELIEMDIIAQTLGVSRSKLLAMMLELADLGWLEIVRALGMVRGTTSLNSVHSHQHLDILERTYKTQISHHSDPYIYGSWRPPVE